MSRALPVYTVAELEKHAAIQLPSLTNDEAVDLGLVAVQVIRERDVSLAVDIVLEGDLVFRAKLKSTGPGNDPWLAGKAAVAMQFGEPSLLVKMRHVEAGTQFTDLDLDHGVLKAHGGSIPLRVDGNIVGTLTMSGEPDAIDHETAFEAITRYLATR
jgi:uncharacterized protein (UPF0303 family)